MKLLLFAMLGLVIFNSMTTVSTQRKYDAPSAVATARAQVDQYRMFMYVASQYMKTYTGGAGTLTWTNLKMVDGVPSGAKNADMPATWKVVVDSSGSWVACTSMDEASLGAVEQLATANGKSLNPVQISTNTFVVIGDAADSTKASQCN